MLWSSVVYGVVALCDATLTVYGPPVVSALVAVELATIAWQERRRQRGQARLVELAALVEAKDAYTGQHLSDVAQRTALVAAELDLSARLIEDVSGGALLHDLGKLAVSSQVLTKPGTLEPQEWEEVRAHTTVGQALLRSLPDLTTAAAIAGHHHERWDGRGYPDGLAGPQIPLAARIVCVVDAFDAMTTDRPYHRAIPQDRAFAELERESGRQFDMDVVGAFGRAMLVPARLPRWQCFAPLEE
jgi:HD-GYP domain-containing protein (c-di-GMP phosphodiesterase class II)